MRLTLAQKALERDADDGDGPHGKEQHRAAVVCERDEAKRRIAAGYEQVDAAVVDDAKHALGARGLNRMVERGGQIFENDADAIDNRRGHVGRASAAQGSEYDQEHQARDTQQAADTMGDGVHDLLAHRVLRNGRGLGSRLRTVARIGHAGYILQRKEFSTLYQSVWVRAKFALYVTLCLPILCLLTHQRRTSIMRLH